MFSWQFSLFYAANVYPLITLPEHGTRSWAGRCLPRRASTRRLHSTPARHNPSSHVLFQRLFDPRLRNSPDDLVNLLAILEHQQGRNSHDIKPARRRRVLVRVQLPERHLAAILFGEPVDYRRDQTAGATPRRPAVDEDQGILRDERVEAGIVNLHRRISHNSLAVQAII